MHDIEAATAHRAMPEANKASLFDRVPRLVFWETTKACPLACVHCRATAQRAPAPNELTTDEAKSLIDELASAGRPTPVLILTGGDCLQRGDLEELTAYAQASRVPVAVSPSVSPSLNSDTLSMLFANGVRTASLSLDGAFAGTHDQVRQVPGHFADTVGRDRASKSAWLPGSGELDGHGTQPPRTCRHCGLAREPRGSNLGGLLPDRRRTRGDDRRDRAR